MSAETKYWDEQLTHELLHYCGPIFIAPHVRSYPKQMVGNGTYLLLDTGEARLLVTCCHVWEAYEKERIANPETVLALALGEGRSCISFKNPEQHILALDAELDLAVFQFEPEGIPVQHNQSWFKVSEWPIEKVKKGDAIVTLGYPGVWRTTEGEECKFGCTAIPLIVSDTTHRTIAAFCDEDNRQVLSDLKDSLGGISGAAAFRLAENGELHLAGFARLGSLESTSPDKKVESASGSPLLGILFSHAAFLQPNGTLLD